MKQPKFEIGDVLYNNGHKLGQVCEIVIRSDVIYYIFGLADLRYDECSLTDKAPAVDVKMDMADIEILHQFFGDMNQLYWNHIVSKQSEYISGGNSIMPGDVGDVPLRIYTILHQVIKNSK